MTAVDGMRMMFLGLMSCCGMFMVGLVLLFIFPPLGLLIWAGAFLWCLISIGLAIVMCFAPPKQE